MPCSCIGEVRTRGPHFLVSGSSDFVSPSPPWHCWRVRLRRMLSSSSGVDQLEERWAEIMAMYQVLNKMCQRVATPRIGCHWRFYDPGDGAARCGPKPTVATISELPIEDALSIHSGFQHTVTPSRLVLDAIRRS